MPGRCCGVAGDISFCGHSMLIDPLGEVIAEAGEKEAVIVGEVDFRCVDEMRSNIDVLRDRRPSLYDL